MTRERDAMLGSTITWTWTKPLTLGLDDLGTGPTVLFLPAPSSISTRQEMLPLMRELAPRFRTVAVDLPGFGAGPKPAVDWTPEAYRRFVADMLERFGPCRAVVASGHAATFALQAAHDRPGAMERLAMIAPTWRGPLPTVLGLRPRLYATLRRAGDLPGLGAGLYRANVNGPMLRMMSTEHVYSDRRWLSGARLEEKTAVIGAAGARYAALRFVTGGLDPLPSRTAWLKLVESAPCPVMIVYGAEMPRRTRAEIEAAAGLPGVQSALLPAGKLGLHEEFPAAVAAKLQPFLDGPDAADANDASDA